MYKLIVVNKETYIVQILYRPADFRSTVVKPYYTGELNNNDITIVINTCAESKESTVNTELENTNKESTLPVSKENA